MTVAAPSQKARQAYQANQVVDQDPMELIVMLYDGLLGFLKRAAVAVEEQNTPEASECFRRATDIVGELQAVLDMEAGGEIAANLDRIYTYSRRRIVEGHVNLEPEPAREIVELLAPLRDAWAEAREKQRAGS